MVWTENIRLLRSLVREIHKVNPTECIKDSLILKYVFDQFRKYKITDQQLCKAQEEMKFMANTYLCYLRSMRRYQEINKEFHGKGERSVEETARMVGFKLPHDPK